MELYGGTSSSLQEDDSFPLKLAYVGQTLYVWRKDASIGKAFDDAAKELCQVRARGVASDRDTSDASLGLFSASHVWP